jgi:hypothetical protein
MQVNWFRTAIEDRSNAALFKEVPMLMWIHPIVQGLTLILALYVLWLGLNRFASRHLKKKTAFKWQRHVTLGKLVVVIWALGGLGGLLVTYISYGKIFPESLHFQIGMATLVLLAVAWLTGVRMDRNRNQSDMLPVVHLVNNAVLLVLVVIQLVTGIGIVQSALLK